MPDQNTNNLTPEQQAEQARQQQQQASRPQIHSRPRELAKQAKAAYKQGKEFVADPRAKMAEVGKNLKDRAMQPINQAKDAANAIKNAPKNIADKGKKAVDAVRSAPQNIAKSAKNTVDQGKKAVQAVKNAPQNIKKGVEVAKAGVQAAKVGLQATKAAGGLLAKGGLKAGIGAAAGAATAGVGTAALAAADATAAAAKAGIKATRKVLKQFNADLIGKMEDKIWDAITGHFKKYWKMYLAGAIVMPVLVFVTAFMIVFLAFNSGFDKDSPAGQADIASFISVTDNSNLTFEDGQLDDFTTQVKEGMVSSRLIKFLNEISKDHNLTIAATPQAVEDDPNIKFDPVQIGLSSVDSIKCTNSKTKTKYNEFPIALNQGFDWQSLVPTDENLKNEVICAIDYYPLIEPVKESDDLTLSSIFSPGEFAISTLAKSALAAAQVKIAELIITADNYPTDSEGINIAPASMEIGNDLASKNFRDPSDVSLKTFFKSRANKNIEDVDSLFQSPSSLSGGALVFFL